MTFEEFFAKKKIDLMRLKRIKPGLYEEFRNHYTEMGARSFDHTKKYWFNRLRKDFLLEVDEPPKGGPAGAPTDSSRSAVPTTEVPPPANTTAKSLGFRPRFKADTTAPAKSAEPGEGEAAKPQGFRSRFKAAKNIDKGDNVS